MIGKVNSDWFACKKRYYEISLIPSLLFFLSLDVVCLASSKPEWCKYSYIKNIHGKCWDGFVFLPNQKMKNFINLENILYIFLVSPYCLSSLSICKYNFVLLNFWFVFLTSLSLFPIVMITKILIIITKKLLHFLQNCCEKEKESFFSTRIIIINSRESEREIIIFISEMQLRMEIGIQWIGCYWTDI